MDIKQVITSRQNPLIKSICALSEKKRRIESGLFRFDGVKLLYEAISSSVRIKYIVYRENSDEQIDALVQRAVENGRVETDGVIVVSESVFSKLSEEKSPEGVITVAYIPEALHSSNIEVVEGERILIAESLRDPGNLGTVIRSCYALGIDKLVITSDCADLYNPKTIRAAMGAIFALPILVVDTQKLPEFILEQRGGGRRVYATALHTNSLEIGELALKSGDCFVIGNEGHGLSERAIDACTAPVIIPMREGAESLNAAAAAAICIWETVKAK
jgi:TrmH family RNA methyltransferase